MTVFLKSIDVSALVLFVRFDQDDAQKFRDDFLHFIHEYYLLSQYSNKYRPTYHSSLEAYSNNNCFNALPFLPQASCNGDLPLEFFILGSAPRSRRTCAI